MKPRTDHLPPTAVAARDAWGAWTGISGRDGAGHASRGRARRPRNADAGISDRRRTWGPSVEREIGEQCDQRASLSGCTPKPWDQRPPTYMLGASFPAFWGALWGYRLPHVEWTFG